MKILILTEGGKEKGFGHITRCIALAQGFKEKSSNIKIKFLVNSDNSVKDLFEDLDVYYLNWINNEESVFKLINKKTIVILDSYYASKEFCQELSDKSKLCVFIDDYNRIEYPSGIIVNGTINAEKIPYKRKSDQVYLLGIDYAYLRKEFWNVKDKKINDKIENILITFGGNDIRNMIPKILNNLKKYNCNKYVFLTDVMKNIDETKTNVDDKTFLIYNPNAEKIVEIMSECDIAITAAGQTLFETAKTGLPSIVVKIIENQSNNVKFWKGNDIILYAGNYDDEKLFFNIDNSILKLNKELRKNIIKKSQNLIDGKGVFRIVSAILKLL